MTQNHAAGLRKTSEGVKTEKAIKKKKKMQLTQPNLE